MMYSKTEIMQMNMREKYGTDLKIIGGTTTGANGPLSTITSRSLRLLSEAKDEEEWRKNHQM